MPTTLLAIESSCDDTSASVLMDGEILSNCVANQDAHRLYGGVVPEVASRAHQINIIPVVDLAIRQAGIKKTDLDAVAFTRGPGLMGSLIVGVAFAKSLALSLNIPLIEVNHMDAHVLAHFAEDPKPKFPFLCLTVSGGHTQIVKVSAPDRMEVLGQTLDDAAGEAFDKTGKLLGLEYPAGPIIDKLAQQGKPVYDFPEPRIPDLDFSFSGLKTSILYFLKEKIKEDPEFIEQHLNDICASVQDRIVSILLKRLRKAARRTGIKEIAIAGGVSANSALRSGLSEMGRKEGWQTYIPKFEYCTDNAAMIAVAGYFKYQAGQFTDQSVQPAARF
ncbi:tRNA (adenosine(37)-N6)-threonylcarbamoyltransferase complex transferase subunit TsaD [Phaeodactylibacter sp.]|uniref:tRNA (adenosine(37)-N6)-threonylcarbamoyltransferase complex transferase subunit TsaD n=1 Tax=Phaeodactylibacter sp. TaxID=1940289 RepID=UPI00260144CB|nr:tRNA (adenosine(37)-N6)-threonylcarbamoyltransferase complex transferase subunit TsaD [Phaeodactylibacter sp.]MCI4648142.1 tRNA (adenosine(37)-N6)-threonylcarbamoyltransferase complex transferase subunit TsaD [Phaeodactylibacter sp.]MCI5090886.1 tRNA (adenosine(37)-N6)-threonylcarbamoyltransferase complex transferase subunit TsaD [Phaeodactylibacter sp.]